MNRLLFDRQQGLSAGQVYNSLHKVMKPEDTGLSLRFIPSTGGYELISDRIFIDQPQLDVSCKLPFPAFPVITYLANSIENGERSTPYSFVSALDSALYDDVPAGNAIVINEWLADDLDAKEGDTLLVTWYSPDPMNRLTVESTDL
jgi:hypothetical protein